MSSSASRPPMALDKSHAKSATDADRAFLLALSAWSDRCRRPVGPHEPTDFAAASRKSMLDRLSPRLLASLEAARNRGLSAANEGPTTALEHLRSLHQGTARVDLERVHPTWLIRALREESPAVQRIVVASFAAPRRHALQAGLLLDSRDLMSERAPAPEVARWVLSLWSERLVGGEAERADDPPAIVILSRLSGRSGYRVCRTIGFCKLILAGRLRTGLAISSPRSRRDWLESRVAEVDEHPRSQARRDIDSSQIARVPPRHRTARIGLTTVARLLAAAEPFRLRWALQHWPYPIAKLIRTLLPAAATQTPALVESETMILKLAWDCLITAGQITTPWPESTEFGPRSPLT